MEINAPDKRFFPCPLCGEALEARASKRKKPYVVCGRCGVQMFVRTQPGIQRFEKLIGEAESRNMWDRLAALEKRYQKQCPKCGTKFWTTDKLIETHWFDGSFTGYKCSEEGCDGIVEPEREEDEG